MDEPSFTTPKKTRTSFANRRKPLIGSPTPMPPGQKVHSKKGDPVKRHSSRIGILLEVLIFSLIGLVVIRVFFLLSQVDQMQRTRDQYQAYYFKQPGRFIIDHINPRPLGLKGDGLFNEAFDDEIAFDSTGLTKMDAHDVDFDALTDQVNICSLPGEQCLNTADKLVTLMFKAFVAQWLGLIDMLIGLNAICLFLIGAIWLVRRQRSKLWSITTTADSIDPEGK